MPNNDPDDPGSATGGDEQHARLRFPDPPILDHDVTLEIDATAEWGDLPHASALHSITLAHLANHLSMVDLRRATHRAAALLDVGGTFTLDLLDPDPIARRPDPPWPGSVIPDLSPRTIHRPLRHWVELLRLFPFEIPVPRPVPGHPDRLRITARRLEEPARGALSSAEDSVTDRYAPTTAYRRFDRLEEPEIVDDLLYAWSRLASLGGERVLSLGANDGRELDLVAEAFEEGARPERWGIDHSVSAVEAARARFPDEAERFVVADLADLRSLELPTFSVVLALGVLQCTSVDRDRLLTDLKTLLAPRAGVLFSIPDCHRGAHDILRRPYRRDDPRADRSRVAKDVRFLVRWCHRMGFERVETFGSYDAFVLGMRSGRRR